MSQVTTKPYLVIPYSTIIQTPVTTLKTLSISSSFKSNNNIQEGEKIKRDGKI